jgi:hypothetical protein
MMGFTGKLSKEPDRLNRLIMHFCKAPAIMPDTGTAQESLLPAHKSFCQTYYIWELVTKFPLA